MPGAQPLVALPELPPDRVSGARSDGDRAVKLLVLWAIWRRITQVDAVRDARKISKELGTRPFSDKNDENWGGGGYGAAPPGQSSFERGERHVLKPIPPHPRARRTTQGDAEIT